MTDIETAIAQLDISIAALNRRVDIIEDKLTNIETVMIRTDPRIADEIHSTDYHSEGSTDPHSEGSSDSATVITWAQVCKTKKPKAS